MKRVLFHTQRKKDGWFINSIILKYRATLTHLQDELQCVFMYSLGVQPTYALKQLPK